MPQTDKEVYNSKICIYCKHYNECSKNKFKVYVFNDKVSMRCIDYEFKDMEN